MAYEVRHTHVHVKNSNGEKTTKTRVDAKFNFRKEASPKDRRAIRKRLDWTESPLRSYLAANENIIPRYTRSSTFGDTEMPNKCGKSAYIINSCLGFSMLPLNLHVNVEVDGLQKLEEVFDCEALEQFILTGEYPKRGGTILP